MKIFKFIVLFTVFIIFFGKVYPFENHRIDSLTTLLKSAISDTTRASTLVSLAKCYYNKNADTLLLLCNQAIDIVNNDRSSCTSIERTSFLHANERAFRTIGYCYTQQGNIRQALEYYYKSLKILEELNDIKGQASLLRNIAYLHMQQGDNAEVIKFFNRELALWIKAKSTREQAYCLSDIGYYYSSIKDTSKALEYFNKTYEIDEEIGDSAGMSYELVNIGYMNMKKWGYKKTLQIFTRSLQLQQNINNQSGIAYVQSNIGTVYQYFKKYELSVNLMRKALNIRKNQKDDESIIIIFSSIASVYFDWNKIEKAIQYADSSYVLAHKLEAARYIGNASELLAKYYKKRAENGNVGDFEKALRYSEEYVLMRDSIINVDNAKAAIKTQMQYTFEKQHLADSLGFAQKEILEQLKHQSELDKETSKRYALYGGVVFLLLLGLLAFRGYRKKKKVNTIITIQKEEVERQKLLVEEKNKEITDSIIYAKRIQKAILPTDKVVKEIMPNSFVLYKPKDIVAGDFYWVEAPLNPPIVGRQGGAILFAAADCTGHGVPGAMVSVVCNNALNRSVREYSLTNPGQILDKTRELVVEELNRSQETGVKNNEEVKDGMDIALCALTPPPMVGAGGWLLQYAGANNPLWIIRNGELMETKADKQPIGKTDEPKPFTTHTFELQKGDAIYIFSDGYIDQFGGENLANRQAGGKKFKAKTFKKLLLSIQEKSMEEQKSVIDETFEAWKGSLEQVDDICVIGVRK